MKSQKQAVIDEVVSMYGQMSVPFVQGGTNALAGLPEPALETIKANIGKAILAGTVEYSKDKSNPNEVMAYARSMVMNHLKKAKELNGGQVYAPATTRVSKTETGAMKVAKSNGINKSILPENLRKFVEEKL